MIWHVPNEQKAYEMSDGAKLKYYTYNNFLNQSTLRDLYANKLPLKQASKCTETLYSSWVNPTMSCKNNPIFMESMKVCMKCECLISKPQLGPSQLTVFDFLK